jgi:hypothetical protein
MGLGSTQSIEVVELRGLGLSQPLDWIAQLSDHKVLTSTQPQAIFTIGTKLTSAHNMDPLENLLKTQILDLLATNINREKAQVV